MKKRPVVLFFAGCVSGMAAVWNEEIPAAVFYCLGGVIFWGRQIRRDRRYLIGLLGMAIGMLLLFAQRHTAEQEIRMVEKKAPKEISGVVLKSSQTERSMAYLIQCQGWDGKLLLYDTSNAKVRTGDWILAETKVEIQEKAGNPGQFSARNYYFARGIYYRGFAERIYVKGYRKNPLENVLEKSREWMKDQIQEQYSKEEAGLIQGMLLGDKSLMEEEQKDDFKESGLIHLLAVSGLHISLAGRSIYRILRRIGAGFLLSSAAGFFTALYYGMLTGGSVSSIRAVLMLGIYFLSQVLGKNYDLLSSAALAGSLILIRNPLYFGDTGFLLSFCAVIIIGCIGQETGKKKKVWGKVLSRIVFPLKLQTGMLPLMIYLQYETPVFSFLANAAAVPAASVGFAMALAFVWLPPLFLHRWIQAFFWAVLKISQIKYGMITIGQVPLWWVAAGYIVFYLAGKKKVKMPFSVRVGVIYMGILCMTAVPVMRRKTIAFLDVGQGDCMMAETAGGMILADGGSSSVKKTGRYRMLPYLKSRGKQKIKIAVISHMDEDHYSGILELLEMGRIEYLGLPDVPRDTAYESVKTAAEKAGTVIFLLAEGKVIKGADFYLKVLHPPAGSSLEKNAASLVLQGNINGKRILLTGDVEKEGEKELLRKGLKQADILKVAHHGSKNSTSEEFLSLVKPVHAVISCGKENRYGHPHKEVTERILKYNSRIHRTDKEGAVIFW